MLPECHGREDPPSGAGPFVFQEGGSSFLPSSSGVTPNDRGIQCICGVRVVWYSSYVHSVAFHIILALSKGTGSGRQQIQPGRGLRAAVNFKPGPRQNWNSKATGSRSSTQRLSYALHASVLVGHDTGVLFFRGVVARQLKSGCCDPVQLHCRSR